MRRRFLCMALICAMAFTACGEEETSNNTQIVKQEENEIKYELIQVTLPDAFAPDNMVNSFGEPTANNNVGFVADVQGNPAVYQCNMSFEGEEYNTSITRYTLNAKGKDWETEDLCNESLSKFLNAQYEKKEWKRCEISDFKRGDNGNLYCVFTYYVPEEEDGEEVMMPYVSILEVDEDNDKLFEIPLQDIKFQSQKDRRPGADWQQQMSLLADYHAMEDGQILVTLDSMQSILVDGESGKTLAEVGSLMSERKANAYGEGEMIFYSSADNAFEVVDIENGEKENEFGKSLGDDELAKDWNLFMNADTWELYAFNGSQIYKTTSYQDADEFETLTGDADMAEVVGMGTVLDFFVDEEEGFYIITREMGMTDEAQVSDYKIMHLKKVEE